MKHLYLMICFSIFVGNSYAQKNLNTNIPASVHSSHFEKNTRLQNLGLGHEEPTKGIEEAVFTEDFANGLDGNNELNAAWIAAGPNADLWRHDFEGAQDQWSVETGTNIPLESTTASNGFMLFTPGEYNQPLFEEQGIWESVSGWIQSPEMDLSELNSVLVDYQIYYRYCCYSPSPIKIGVSVDGGDNWTNFNAYGYSQFIEIAKNFSGTLPVTTDISSVAANQSSVIIRFSYNDPIWPEADPNFGFYFLGVDDVSVYENPYSNNLKILQVMNGDVDNLWEFKNFPLEQSADLYLGAVYGNFGSSNQTDVSIYWEVMDGNEIIHTSSINLGDVTTTKEDPSGAIVQNIDTAWINTGYTIGDVGNFTIRASIQANEEDQDPENNQVDRFIKVTEDVMSHDDLDDLDIQIGPRKAGEDDGFLYEETGFGTRFFVVNPGSMAYGFQVVFGDSTTIGAEAYIEFYEVDETVGINNATSDNMPGDFAIEENEFVIEASDMGIPVFIAFDEPVELEVGKTYFASVRQFEGDEEIWVMGTDNTDTDNSSYVREKSGSGVYAWFSRATELAVRLGFDFDVAVNEIAKDELVFSLVPNPTSDRATLSYQLTESQMVSYAIYDANGRLIDNQKLGMQNLGVNQINLELSGFEVGIYYVILSVGETVVSEKVIVAQ